MSMRGSASFLLLTLALSLACPWSAIGAEGSSSPSAVRSRELLLRYDRAGKRLTLLHQRELAISVPRQRDLSLQHDELLLRGEAADGTPLWTLPIPDPTDLYIDEPDPAGPPGSGRLTGGRKRLPEADLLVLVPPTPGVVRVSLYAPHATSPNHEGHGEPELSLVGVSVLVPSPQPSP